MSARMEAMEDVRSTVEIWPDPTSVCVDLDTH